MIVERTHDAAHVDALELGLERHGAGYPRLERDRPAAERPHLDRQPEIRHAHLLDRHFRTLDGSGRAYHVGQFRAIGRRDLELRVVAARNPRLVRAGNPVEI